MKITDLPVNIFDDAIEWSKTIVPFEWVTVQIGLPFPMFYWMTNTQVFQVYQLDIKSPFGTSKYYLPVTSFTRNLLK